MSSSLGWIPVVEVKYKWIDTQLKFILRNKYDVSVVDTTMDYLDIPYLKGLRDGGVKDADTLINAIDKHGTIKILEEF